MKITKYVTPVSQLDAVFDRLGLGLPAVDRLFSETSSSADSAWSSARLPPRTFGRPTTPTCLHDDAGALPGDPVNIEGDTLVIEARSGSRTYGQACAAVSRDALERTFGVGDSIDREQVRAKIENGILTVTLPKVAEKVGRKIDVA
jgi:hypothetical protein